MRRRWAAVGVGAVLLGLAFAVVGDGVPIGLDTGEVLGIGYLAVAVAAWRVWKRIEGPLESHVDATDVERGPRAPIPGDRFDRVLRDPGGEYPMLPAGTNREYVLSVTRSLVRSTLEVERDYGPDEAERAVERGTWTDDPVAAWFLGDTDKSDPPAFVPRRIRLRGAVDPAVLDEYAVGRTIDAIERIRGGSS